MSFLQNPVVIENISNLVIAFLVAFAVSFLSAPFIGLLAKKIDAGDKPKSRVSKTERDFTSRINSDYKPRLGGLAMFFGLMAVLLVFNIFNDLYQLNSGFLSGVLVIVVLGVLDDKYKLPGSVQLFMQLLAAILVVINIEPSFLQSISLLGNEISLNWFTIALTSFIGAGIVIVPAHFFYIIWILFIINVVNWASAVDCLNISISSIASFTLLLFVLAAPEFQFAIALVLVAHIGGNLGYFPYNYNPSKLIPGSVGEYLNGFLLAVLAIYSSTKWSVTFVLFGLFILDAIIVIYGRLRRHPEARRNPLKVLSINDTNHLHHRLMNLGYSKKAVLLIELMMMTILCAIAVIFGIEAENSSSQLLISLALGLAFLVTSFTMIFVLQNKTRQKEKEELLQRIKDGEKRRAVVNVYVEGENSEEDEEKFVY